MSNTWLILIAGLAQTVILGTMGFTRTVHPEFTQKHKWKIFSAYIAIALLVTVASTFLSYEKDIKNQAAVDNMSKQIATLQKQTKRSPRFEFAGIKTSTADDGSILATPQFLNTSDVDAISYRMVNSIARRTTLPTQGDISAMDKELSKYQMGPMPNGTGISRGMGGVGSANEN
jgi:hypothetical protein